ncbi:MAG: hypothetical protein KF764_16620 [Labilithrix sp.]|nr:hypothetical protein [Labilithrix sp.]
MRLSLVGALGASVGLCALAACVPADEALRLGSVQFSFRVSERTQEGVDATETLDGWSIRFERTVLGFKTMTIGQIGVPDVCSYRGRGAESDIVFDPRLGAVQTFNGIQPVECPDVGIIFGPPGAETTLGAGVTSKDLVDLASGVPAHAIIEAVASREALGSREPETLRIVLRFDSTRTSTRFGGCRAAARGVRVLEGERDQVSVRLAAEHLFRDAIAPGSGLRVEPFALAGRNGDGDDVVTMAELDGLRLNRIPFGGDYQIPNGISTDTFGDYVRVLFRFAFMFRNEDGLCVGNEPGSEEGGQAPPEP